MHQSRVELVYKESRKCGIVFPAKVAHWIVLLTSVDCELSPALL